MIYLDNAATTYPKPQQVYRRWTEAIRTYGANPGRGGYEFSAATSQAVYESRAACAELFFQSYRFCHFPYFSVTLFFAYFGDHQRNFNILIYCICTFYIKGLKYIPDSGGKVVQQ